MLDLLAHHVSGCFVLHFNSSLLEQYLALCFSTHLHYHVCFYKSRSLWMDMGLIHAEVDHVLYTGSIVIQNICNAVRLSLVGSRIMGKEI